MMEETPADTNENDRENLILSFEDAAKIAQARATSNEFQQKKSTSELKGLKRKKTIKVGKHTQLDESTGQYLFKSASATEIAAALQLGISNACIRTDHTKNLKEDMLLVQDFSDQVVTSFPSCGSNTTPKHNLPDFKFTSFSPKGFKYFRQVFGITDQEFVSNIITDKLKVIGNPGGSGAMMWLTNSDLYVIKTVTSAQAKFLHNMLNGYYMTLHQNPNTLLTKFYGLYTLKINSIGRSIRIVVMRNFFPFAVDLTHKFDLKGSTISRFASEKEKKKSAPTYRDLDFNKIYGTLRMEEKYYNDFVTAIQKDTIMLKTFDIFDYSLLLGVVRPSNQAVLKKLREYQVGEKPLDMVIHGGIPAMDKDGNQCYLYVGIVDLLQEYDAAHQWQYGWKAVKHGCSQLPFVSVQPPGKYKDRFQKYILDECFTMVKDKDVNQNIDKRRGNKLKWQKALGHIVSQKKEATPKVSPNVTPNVGVNSKPPTVTTVVKTTPNVTSNVDEPRL